MAVVDHGGDFYVDCETCLSCDAPRSEAPDLMDHGENGCFFTRQPSTPEEVERACTAVCVSCVEGVRYRGSDRTILRRLYDLGAFASCDVPRSPTENRVVSWLERLPWTRIHWTYLVEDSATSAIVACCSGSFPHTLSIFAVDKIKDTIESLMDDKGYRPRLNDCFKTPKSIGLGYRLFGWVRKQL